MNKLSKYNDFITEREFQKIVYQIYKLVESAYTQEWDLTGNNNDKVNVGDTIVWDIDPKKPFVPTKDEDPIRMEWNFDQKSKLQKFKSKVSELKSKLSKFSDYINEPDPDVEVKFDHPLVNMVKEFLSKLKDKEEVKRYFLKLLEEIKSLPYPIKKKLLIKISFIFLSYISLSDLTPKEVIDKEPVMAEVKLELQKETPSKQEFKKKEVTNNATFDNANKLVSLAEGGYTDNPIDAGNWTNGPDSKSGHLIGTNHGIAAFTIINTNTKPKSDAEIKALKQCYGRKYEKFCGKELLSFGEQWRLDQKYIDSKNIGIKWKNIQKALSKETATEIYENEYWNLHDFSKFKSQSIANILYDACVNQGPGVPGNVLITSMNKLGYDVNDVNNWDDIHSKLTPIVNSMDTNQLKKLHHEIGLQRLQKYGVNKSEDEMTADEKEFSKGWRNRINKEDINKFEEGGGIS